MLRAPLLISGTEGFRDLVRLSVWSMNVPSRPTDGLLVEAIARSAEAVVAAPRPMPGLLDALRSGDATRLETALRDRRRAARAAAPLPFRRVRARSAGLRPLAMAIDLLPALARHEAARQWLAGLDHGRAASLLAGTLAIFI